MKHRKPAVGVSAPRAHLEHPAIVINAVYPCAVPEAPEVLDIFEKELYPSGPNADLVSRKFHVRFSHWGPKDAPHDELMLFATAVFPREGIPRLAEICRDNGLVLVRGVTTLVDGDTAERVPFDYTAAVSDCIDTVPEVEDIYTFARRESENAPLIICGVHAHELPADPRTVANL